MNVLSCNTNIPNLQFNIMPLISHLPRRKKIAHETLTDGSRGDLTQSYGSLPKVTCMHMIFTEIENYSFLLAHFSKLRWLQPLHLIFENDECFLTLP